MHFRAPHRNLAITMLLTRGVAGCNDEYPDTTSDTDGTGPATTVTTATTQTTATATAGGSGSQAEDEDEDDTDGRPNEARSR